MVEFIVEELSRAIPMAMVGRMSEVVDEFETPAMPLGSFPAIFSQALSLGVLSRRRVYQEALQVMSASTPLSRLIGGVCLAALQ